MRKFITTDKALLKLLTENKKLVTDFNKTKFAEINKEYAKEYKEAEADLQDFENKKNERIAKFKAYEATAEVNKALDAKAKLHNKINDISKLLKDKIKKLPLELDEFEIVTNAFLSEDGKEITVEIIDKVESYKEQLRNQNVQDKK